MVAVPPTQGRQRQAVLLLLNYYETEKWIGELLCKMFYVIKDKSAHKKIKTVSTEDVPNGYVDIYFSLNANGKLQQGALEIYKISVT